MSSGEPRKIAQFIKENPHATQEEIQEFADEHHLSVSFSGPSQGDPTEPGYGRFTYTNEDLKDMGAPWLHDDDEVRNLGGESNGQV